MVASLAVGVERSYAEGEQERHSSALEEDAQRSSYSDETTTSEALAEADYQEEVTQIIDPLIDKYHDVYAEAGFDGPESSYILLKGEIPPEVLDTLSGRPDIRVEGGAEFSREEADAASVAIADEIERSFPSGTPYIVHVDVASAESEVVVGKSSLTTLEGEIETAVAESDTIPICRGSIEGANT